MRGCGSWDEGEEEGQVDVRDTYLKQGRGEGERGRGWRRE